MTTPEPRPWKCLGCGSALGLLVGNGGVVELDQALTRVLLDQRGAVVHCIGCHARRRWEVAKRWEIQITAGTTAATMG